MNSMSKIQASGYVAGALTLVGLFVWQNQNGTEIVAEEFSRLPEPREVKNIGAPACSTPNDTGLGPEMAQMPEGFCIDKTEVTRAQYEAWLVTEPSVDSQTGACAENADYAPSCNWPPGGSDGEKPVVCVDWCDAQAFCEAADKRLCGQIGDGGAYPIESYDDATVSEWHAACSSGGAHEFTYGDEWNTDSCRDGDAEDYTTWGMWDVGSTPSCQSPEPDYAEVFDLSGNVAEWDGSCEGDSPDDGCRIRGGSFEHQGRGTRCAMAKGLRWPRMRAAGSVGFRCCSD